MFGFIGILQHHGFDVRQFLFLDLSAQRHVFPQSLFLSCFFDNLDKVAIIVFISSIIVAAVVDVVVVVADAGIVFVIAVVIVVVVVVIAVVVVVVVVNRFISSNSRRLFIFFESNFGGKKSNPIFFQIFVSPKSGKRQKRNILQMS